MKKIKLVDYFKRFKPGSSHHLAAIYELERLMPDDLLSRKSTWVDIFNSATSEEL